MKPRKLILSRKGFDLKSGGCPSPIFPDGTMYSLPVPGADRDDAPIPYGNLHHGSIKIGQAVKDLTRGHYDEGSPAHLDPDVRPDALPRQDEWRGLFGQTSAAESHLENEGVGAGDLFLFFGIYRRVQKTPTGWRFVRKSPQQHILWGWLQIEQVCKVDQIWDDKNFYWAHYHPHFAWENDPSNTLYVATRRFDTSGSLTAPGSGIFPLLDDRLVLTRPGGSVSQWRLPRWFYPDGNKTPLTYHPDRTRWKRDGNYAYLQSVGRGQEFVLDLWEYPDAIDWISGLVGDLASPF